MTQNINELEQQILQMNLMLDSLDYEGKVSNDKAKQLELELDSLLYKYYKLLKCI